jgi:hypothetical protein
MTVALKGYTIAEGYTMARQKVAIKRMKGGEAYKKEEAVGVYLEQGVDVLVHGKVVDVLIQMVKGIVQKGGGCRGLP